jgi:polyisoprenyl-phosphate glycosyltransferase
MSTKVLVSIVTPCFNEEGNVSQCAAEVAAAMAAIEDRYDYEHIFCDNASSDGTLSELRALAAQDRRIKVVCNSANVGPLRNIANGLTHTSGALVIPMVPADVQDPPEVIPEMLAALSPNLDVVYGVRTNRKEGPLLKLFRSLYYFTIKLGGGAAPPSHAGEFLLARRHIIDAVIASRGQTYVRGLVARAQPRFTTVAYEWRRREHGVSKNSFPDLVDQAITGLVTTARRPLRWALFLGMFVALAGVIIAVVNLVLFIMGGPNVAQGIPTIIVGVFLLGGLQLFLTGVIGEYVVSLHAQAFPSATVTERELINFDQPHPHSASGH